MIITVPFSELKIWDVKSFYHQSDIFNKKYPVVLFGEFLTKPIISKVQIEDAKEYKILGARAYGKGAFVNRTVKGDTLKMRTYQQAKPNHLFWCKVDTKNGAFGIITEELADGVASSNMTFAKIETEKANPEFLQLLFKSKRINEYMDGYVSGTTNRKYIKPDQLREEINIVLPPIEEQNRIVENYKEKITLAEKQQKEASNLELEIERYLFDVLDVKKTKTLLKSKGLSLIDFSSLNIWGADRLLRGGDNSILTSNKFENKKLSEIILINPRTDISNLENNSKMSFIPMECISDTYGVVQELKEGEKSNSKGYTKFKDGDLIWARITPCMQNGKSSIVNNLTNGFGYGSTEFHVLRSENNLTSLNYIYHLLRLKVVLEDATNHFTGSAGQQRVPKSYLENLVVPFPPKSIQDEIANYISNIKSQIKKLKEQSEANQSLALKEFENEIFNS